MRSFFNKLSSYKYLPAFSLGVCILLFQAMNLHSQTVYYHIQNTSVYAFLDEMANEQLIDLNSAVKPYSRMFIAQQFDGINQQIGVIILLNQLLEGLAVISFLAAIFLAPTGIVIGIFAGLFYLVKSKL